MCGNAHHQDERAEARVYGATMLAALAAADAPPATAAAVCAAGLPAALSRLLTGPCPPRVRAAVVMCLRRLSLFSACRVRFRGTTPQPNPTHPHPNPKARANPNANPPHPRVRRRRFCALAVHPFSRPRAA